MPARIMKALLMESFDPEKIQGTWYVIRRNLELFDSVKCIKFDLKHDSKIEDLYALTTHWINSKSDYLETRFNIVDDRAHRARFFFESQRDKLASITLGTDYDNYLVGFGVNGVRETYFVASRTKTLTPEHNAAANEILVKNEVVRDWVDVSHDGCPAEH
ncbi:apolipoprotein D [Galendromus occidentalis]|uniref:Apolipoprotein D n=1 Tax=Galendromus occidentalis TaxID=34638 RepID=A0AAJ7WH24_9ACAR|nr:apolipoprotein D [Galendromus occidentalis]